MTDDELIEKVSTILDTAAVKILNLVGEDTHAVFYVDVPLKTEYHGLLVTSDKSEGDIHKATRRIKKMFKNGVERELSVDTEETITVMAEGIYKSHPTCTYQEALDHARKIVNDADEQAKV